MCITKERKVQTMWTKGTNNGYDFQIKHFEEGSEFGINEGRISKLWISKDHKALANYDRGWDIRPTDKGAKAVYAQLLKKYN